MLGCPIDNLTMTESLGRIEGFITSGRPHQHCAVNAAKLVALTKDPAYLDLVRQCDLVNADGQAVVWASRLLGTPLRERVAGIDLMERLLELAAAKGYRVYFLGARQEVLERTVAEATRRCPGLTVAGSHHGYFSEAEEPRLLQTIKASRPDILLVAMGSPRKEYWLTRHLKDLGVPFGMGVGGSFDVVAGVTRRAPRWVQRLGMEWLFRLLQEPGRLWRRYLTTTPHFIWLTVKARMHRTTPERA